MDSSEPTFLDGNAAAGELKEIFVVDVTAASCRCSRCGKMGVVAESRMYAMEPGLIMRCRFCENPLMRIVKGRGKTWLDLRGMQFIELQR